MKILLALALAASVSGAAINDDWAASKGGVLIRDKAGKIVEADLRLSWITDSDLQVLGAIPTLTRIDLSQTRVSDLGFGALKPLRNVTELNLFYAELTGDGALAAIKEWPHLRKLNLRGTKVTDAGLVHLANMPSLEDLDIGYALITDGAFDRLSALTGLKSLSVGGNKITDAGLSGLRLLPQLTKLDVSGAQRTDSGMWAASVTDQGLDTMAALTRLESLNLQGTKISDAGFPKLVPLKNLKELSIGKTQLSARSLAALKQLPRIERLSLYGDVKIDDQAIAILADLPALSWVDLQGTKVTKAGAAKLKAARPKCDVLYQATPDQPKEAEEEP